MPRDVVTHRLVVRLIAPYDPASGNQRGSMRHMETQVPETIARDSPQPYYEQLFEILKSRVALGEIPVGERLPSEMELSREFGLARATVRQTVAKLESEGYVRKVPHRGVFASLPDPESGWIVQDTQGFLESQIRHGRTGITTQVVASQVSTPPLHVSEALQLTENEEVFFIERVRSLNGDVAMFSTNWFSQGAGEIIAGAEDVLNGQGSVNAALSRAGFVTEGAHRVIHSLAAPEKIAAHLEIATGSPVLRVRSWSWDKNGLRFDYYETWVLTDTVPLEVNVTAAGAVQ